MPDDIRSPFSPDHLAVAADRSALAAILDSQGRHREALVSLQEALAIVEAVLGRSHHEVTVLLGMIAEVAERAGELEQAAAHYERLLRIQWRLLGRDHSDARETLSRLRVLRGASL